MRTKCVTAKQVTQSSMFWVRFNSPCTHGALAKKGTEVMRWLRIFEPLRDEYHLYPVNRCE